jgi:hypothetical protein
MITGYSIKIFGGSYLLAVLLPETDTPDICEFKRIIDGKEELLGENGWATPTKTGAKKIRRDINNSPKYFCYYLDENVSKEATYFFRFCRAGSYSPWRTLEDVNRVILPAPKNLRVKRA